jgi:hypothetical protein
LIERCQIDGAVNLRTGQQRFDSRGEQEGVACLGIVQGPNAKTVTGQEELAVRGIPDSKGPLSVEALHKTFALFLVEMKEHFGVGARGESMPLLDEFIAELDEVEDLSIEGDPQRLVRD